MRLQQIFDEAIGQPPPSGIDIDRVVRRQRRVARVRPALAALAVAVVLAAGGGVALQLTGEDSAVQVPGVQPARFPDYLEGTRVIEAVSASMADRTLSLTFTFTTPSMVLHTRCEPADLGGELYAELSVAGRSEEWLYCPTWALPDLPGNSETGEESWAEGLQPGDRVTVTVNLIELRPSSGRGQLPLPAEGTFWLAVAEPVPFEEYKFPSRPSVLAPMPELNPDRFVEVRSDPADPNRRVETTMTWREEYGCGAEVGYPFSMDSQTPGSLRVLVNELDVVSHTWWDYGTHEVGFVSDRVCDEVADGEEVTLAVEPEHMTGDWLVMIRLVR